MTLSWEARPLKEKTRLIVAEKSNKSKDHLLVMPSDCGRDVRLLIDNGIASANSSWSVVERDSDKISKFKNMDLLKNYINVNYHNTELHRVKLNKSVDFAWFDLCGNLTKKDIFWLKKFPFNKNLDLWCTFNLHGERSHTFFKQMLNLLPNIFPDAFNQLQTQYYKNFSDAKIKNTYFIPIIVQWLILKAIVPAATNNHCYFYQDTMPMSLFHLAAFDTTKTTNSSEISNFIEASLNQDFLVSEILKSKTEQSAKLLNSRIKAYAMTTKNPQEYLRKIKEATLRKQENLLKIIFD